MTAVGTRADRGTPLFRSGFRPFFLFGAGWAGVAVPVWVSAYLLGGDMAKFLPGRDWHVHEMLFGYLAAIIAGFLLTAIPNWTGRPPITGRPLIGLFGLWVIGCIAMLLQAKLGMFSGVTDALFLFALAVVIWREVLAGRNWRNAVVCAIVTVFAAANVGVDLRDRYPVIAAVCERLALATPAMLIAVIGGRIVPNFTRNWLAPQDARAAPAPFGLIDGAALVATGVALAAWVGFPRSTATGWFLIAAGSADLVRLARWRGLATGGEALVWILHVGYAWLGVALLLIGLSVLAPSAVPTSTGVHALTAGAFGVMTLAMMTRVSLGHLGLPRTADRKTLLLYVSVNLAALLRVVAPELPDLQSVLLVAAATLWSLAFISFAAFYGPMLASPRVGT